MAQLKQNNQALNWQSKVDENKIRNMLNKKKWEQSIRGKEGKNGRGVNTDKYLVFNDKASVVSNSLHGYE